MSAFLNVLKFLGGLNEFEKWLRKWLRAAVPGEIDRMLPVGLPRNIDTVHVRILGMKFDLTLSATRTA